MLSYPDGRKLTGLRGNRNSHRKCARRTLRNYEADIVVLRDCVAQNRDADFVKRLALTDQKFLSLTLSSLWNCMPGLAGFICRSKAVVITAFCSSPVSLARLSVKVSAMRKLISRGDCSAEQRRAGSAGDDSGQFFLFCFLKCGVGFYPWPAFDDSMTRRRFVSYHFKLRASDNTSLENSRTIKLSSAGCCQTNCPETYQGLLSMPRNRCFAVSFARMQ